MVFHVCFLRGFCFPRLLAWFAAVPAACRGRRACGGSGHGNVTAVDSLSRVEGLCIESIRADLNRWLPLTFTGGPFPINLQGPPPLEEWLQPLPPAAAAATNTKQANPRIGPKSSSCIASWLRPKAKRHRLEKDPEPARLHIRELLSWLIPTLGLRCGSKRDGASLLAVTLLQTSDPARKSLQFLQTVDDGNEQVKSSPSVHGKLWRVWWHSMQHLCRPVNSLYQVVKVHYCGRFLIWPS